MGEQRGRERERSGKEEMPHECPQSVRGKSVFLFSLSPFSPKAGVKFLLLTTTKKVEPQLCLEAAGKVGGVMGPSTRQPRRSSDAAQRQSLLGAQP